MTYRLIAGLARADAPASPALLRLACTIAMLLPLAASAYDAKVIKIADGDTLTVLRGKEQIRVRLAEIDAPEKKQPFGTRSRESLASLCFGKTAAVGKGTQDRYGRTVAHVTCQGRDAGEYQLQHGMAWVYRRYSKDARLIGVEAMAREKRLGLWVDRKPVPPWEWRRIQHKSALE